MPTQPSQTTIPLFHTPSQEGFKLLELPPELVGLLESESPPPLILHATAAAAVLKTPTGKTYSLRQKNTSNALILLQTTEEGAPNAGLDAITTVHETVELIPEEGEAPAPRARGKWHEKFGRGR
ncbi:hypothetical protein B0T14DRAFT_496805 [Immersiella caudata]|uniref:Sister chromatid cohesion protein DCC1 n=1 Tax=Immersiella caudata TaxID=314043 RepID=A0AA39WRF9_9PEZI|nr:hypothetical protein B0T14DRAFT_496805 [Immersiella caudata]